MKLFLISILSFVMFSMSLNAKSIEGKWKTIDDATNKVKSIVEIKIVNGKLYGKVIKTFPDPGGDPDPICDECEGEYHNKKIIGMQIINGLSHDGEKWEKDDGILDPDNGTWYDCKIWLDETNGDILNVRGYIAFFYRTQTWYRVK